MWCLGGSRSGSLTLKYLLAANKRCQVTQPTCRACVLPPTRRLFCASFPVVEALRRGRRGGAGRGHGCRAGLPVPCRCPAAAVPYPAPRPPTVFFFTGLFVLPPPLSRCHTLLTFVFSHSLARFLYSSLPFSLTPLPSLPHNPPPLKHIVPYQIYSVPVPQGAKLLSYFSFSAGICSPRDKAAAPAPCRVTRRRARIARFNPLPPSLVTRRMIRVIGGCRHQSRGCKRDVISCINRGPCGECGAGLPRLWREDGGRER